MNRTFFRVMSALVAVVLIALGGCSGGGPSPKGKQKVAVIISTLNNPWFVVLRDAAMGRAQELGYEAVAFDSQNDSAKEATHFDNVIAGKYAAILFNPTDADASIQNVRRAKAAGIPVFCMDREINANDAAVSQILSDNYNGCVAIGQYFVKTVGKEGKYIELLGLPGDNNTTNRSAGFHSVVDNYEGLKIVAKQTANFDRAKAYEVMSTLLQANPDINAVFCGNDSMAMGAYRALVDKNLDKKVKVFGFDGADDVVQHIREGKIAATGMQFPKTMARTAAELADEYIKGKRDFDQKKPVGVDLVTQENVEKFADFGRKEK
jgi:ABC-type sugar transport system substrate-binding protein